MASIFDPPAGRPKPQPQSRTRTLILSLGEPGGGIPTPSNLGNIKIDDEQPNGVTTLNLTVDATNGDPALFCLHRVMFADGCVWTAEETHVVSNLSLIIEYQEAQ